jgi:hypothetical protein
VPATVAGMHIITVDPAVLDRHVAEMVVRNPTRTQEVSA